MPPITDDGRVNDYPPDIVDGQPVPPLVVTGDYALRGTHDGSVQVERGRFELQGTLRGSLNLHPGTSAFVNGTLAGSLLASSGTFVDVVGHVDGSVMVEAGAHVVVHPSGRIAGSLHNDGTVVIRGAFGGSRTGSGKFRLEDQGYVKQPRIQDGVHHYDW